MVPSEPMNVPKRIPKVIRFCVLIFSVTRKQTAVHRSVQMKLPMVREHHPVMVAAAAPRHAALPSPREYTSPSWLRQSYCIWIPPTGRAIPEMITYKTLNIFIRIYIPHRP